MAVDKIVLKKIIVGTPIKRVTSGAFSIDNISGVNTEIGTESDGSLLAFKTSTGNYEPTDLRGTNNILVNYDSSQGQYSFTLTNTDFTGSIVPDTDIAYDLGTADKKWRDLYLSGDTITLGTLALKDSGGSFTVVDSDGNKVNLDISLSSNNTAVFSFDSSTGTFVFNDSDLAQTDVAETFHKGLTIVNGATIDSATIGNLANTNLTGSQATFDSANIGSLRVTGNTIVDGNLTVTGTETTINTETINLADNTIVLNSNATGTPSEDAGIEIERGDQDNKTFLWSEGNEYWTLGSETLQTTGKILYGNVYSSEGDLPSAGDYHGMFAHVHGTGKGYFAHAGAWHKLLDETSSNTGDLTEGSNLYYTRARFDTALGDATSQGTIRGYVSGDKGLVYNSSTGVFNIDSANIRGMFSASGDLSYNSGTGQFTFDVEQVYTKANFDSDLGDANTGQLPEGTNLYYTTTRADSDFDVRLGTKSTSNLSEGSNLYYTTARADSDAKNAVSVVDAGGDGSFTYNASNGQFVYTGPSAAEVRTHLTANKGLSVSNGEFNIDSANIRNIFSAGGDLSYNSGTGQFSIDVEDVYTKANFDSDFLSRLTTQIDSADFNNLTSTTASLDSAYVDNIHVGANNLGNVPRALKIGDATGSLVLRKTHSGGRGSIYNDGLMHVQTDILEINGAKSGETNTDMAKFYKDSAVELYYNDVLRISTESDGASVVGDFYVGTDLHVAGQFRNVTTTGLAEGTNLYYTTARWDDRLAQKDADDLTEGTTNLYYTSARADSDAKNAVSAGGDLSYNSSTGVVSFTQRTDAQVRGLFSASGDLSYNSSTGQFSFDVEDVYTKSNFDSDLGDALVGGTGITYDSSSDTINLTNTGVTAATYGSATSVPQIAVNAQGQITSASNVTIAGVTGIDFDSSNGTLTVQTTGGNFTDVMTLDPFTTADLTEQTNLYYTDARSRASQSVTDAGGDGSLSYNSSTGVFTYTGPSAAEVRAHLTANKGLSVSDGEFNIDSANVKGMFSAGGDLSYSNGQFSFTQRTDAQVRGLLTANKGLSVSAGGEFNIDSANVKAMFSGGTGVTYSDGAISIGQDVAASDDVTFNDVTVSGNLNVTGTTTQTGSVVTDNNFTGLTNSNTGNSTDFGFYGKYVESSTTKYAGVYYDADNDNTFRLFADTQSVPSTTVNTGATGFANANLIAKDINVEDVTASGDVVITGNLTVNGATVTNSATNTTIEDALIELGSGNTGANSNDLGLILERGTTGDNVFLGWDESQDRIVFATTTATGASTGDLSLTDANIQASRFYGNVTGAVTGTVSDVSNHNTGDISEGSNLYFTNARARSAISGNKGLAYNSTSGVMDIDSANVRGMFSAGGDLSYNSGTGEFSVTKFTTANARSAISAGGDLSYNSGTGVVSFTERTDAEVRGLVSASGDISYNNSTGVVSFTERTDAQVRGLLSAGGDLSYNSSTGEFSVTKFTTANARSAISAGGDLSYNSGTGVMSFTQRTDAQVRGLLSAGGDLSYDNSTGEFSVTKFTTSNARSAISAGGDLSYNSSTGVMSYTKQTASQLLTAVKTVDGASSGLDADLLDGQEGSHYRINVYNNSGTLLN